MTDDPQLRFALHDEDRELSLLSPLWRCPQCNALARLYRFRKNGKPSFFVQCWSSRNDNAPWRCNQPRVPIEGAPSSKEAVRLWRLVCALTRND